MKTIKILLMGVTGDLAKRKVIPAIAQFAEKNIHKFNVELIGFSRSVADSLMISDLLDKNSQKKVHSISNLTFIQGQYDDVLILDTIFTQLDDNERLLIYLAIPPSIFIPFLQKACPLNHNNIDIIIEKPFGQSLEEAKNILDQTNTCILTRRIHFFDHYGFKVSSRINAETLKNFSEYIDGNITNIDLKALESVDTQGRSGYFDQTGTLKDMFQHMITIYQLARQYFKLPLLTSSNVTISNLISAQYDTYKLHAGSKETKTDTYFKLGLLTNSSLNINIESGKSLGIKSTSISLIFENGTEILWNLDPEKHISIIQKGKEVLSFNLIDNNMLDHTRLFECIVSDDFSRFISHEQILETWKLYDLVNNFKTKNCIEPITYLTGIYPLKIA
jgi:glucose-6-phosphate 1-dehydrogenase